VHGQSKRFGIPVRLRLPKEREFGGCRWQTDPAAGRVYSDISLRGEGEGKAGRRWG